MSIDIYPTQHAFSSSGWPQFQSEVRTSAVLIGKRSDAISVISAIAELHCAPPETAVVLSLRGSSTGRLSLDDTGLVSSHEA